KEKQQPFIDIANKILGITKGSGYLQDLLKQESVKKLEGELNHMVYQLFDLTEEEIAIVEESVGR
ncbi:MAG: hypothetical protein ACTSQ8_23350, partial [Candidatus Helarchaeota archaeon]